MNFSTRLWIVVSFCGDRSPDADTSSAVMVAAASSNGVGALGSASELKE